MRLAHAIATLLTALAIGCGDAETEAPPASPCAAPTRLVGDRCLGPGIADDGCPAGTLGLPDGSCRPAGMLSEDCAEGFVHVPFAEQIEGASYVAGSCEPILPADPCPPGLMAVPGDAVCRPIMDCGSGKWGDIPVDAATVYVDQTFAGMSDGSAAAPWTSIGQAVAAASPGALIAIAAGSYVEDLFIIGKPLRIWGACPEQVELVGTGVEPAALEIRTGASGSEVRGLAVRGAVSGVLLNGSQEALFERLWVHDNAERGINAQSTFGPTSFTVRASLVEHNHEAGVYVSGSNAAVEATVVRDTLPNAQGLIGLGIAIQANPTTGAPSIVTVRASLVEKNRELGIYVSGSEATVEATVVRTTAPNAQGRAGHGISIRATANTGAPSLAAVRASLVEHNHEAGVLVAGSQATVEATVARDTLPNSQGSLGRGINIQFDTGRPSLSSVRASFLDQNNDLGLFVGASEATVETTIVRGTLANAQGLVGRGIGIQAHQDTGAPSIATVRSSLLEGNHEVGVYVGASETTVEATVVRGTLPNAQGVAGRGIGIEPNPYTGAPSLGTVRASLIELNHEIGVYVAASDARIEACRISATQPNAGGLFGDGLLGVSEFAVQAHVFVDAARIDDSARAGVANFGASVSLGATIIGCAAYPLQGEPFLGADFVFEDRGGNACGCPEPTGLCKAVSNGLAPPERVAPIQ